ncbi:MAG: vitamin K epoxide reductase family protein [Microbacteriaceae bacterium]|nr:MAG: vitamin K epoxide reductase family protein [Microbacteriaceae bacterium]
MTDAVATTGPELDPELEDEREELDERPAKGRPWIFGIWLVIGGLIGELAAFMLTIEKIEVLRDPDAILSCNVSVFVQCGKNLESWQGSLFGFPNPLIGLIAWMAPIIMGVAVLAGVRFPRWWWIAFNAGVALAVVFVVWLASQSIFAPNLRTICPYCLLTWSVTYPTFFAVTFRNMAEGVFGDRARRAGRALLPWVAPLTLVVLIVILGIAQLQFPVIQSLFV